MRAVIDIGTNSVLMLVGERDEHGHVRVVEDRSTVTRLGQGVTRTGRLLPDAIERTLAVLREYRIVAGTAGLEAVATEGLRLAENAEAFLAPAAEALGRPVRVISGDEEARLSYLSVAREVPSAGPLRVLDIGGGSTELVVGRDTTVEDARSHALGSVRLAEAFALGPGPIDVATLAAMEARAREVLGGQPVAAHPELHGLAGTVTTAAALMLGLSTYERDRVDGTRFSVEQVVELRARTSALSVAERARLPTVGPGRADVLPAGLSILIAALRHCGAATLVVRDRGLRFALL